MNKMWIVARREYLTNLRRPSFLFAAFGVPVFTIAVMLLVFALVDSTNQTDVSTWRIGYVDNSAIGVLQAAADKPDNFAAFASEEQARAALDSGDLNAYFVVPGNYMLVGLVRLYSFDNVPQVLQDDVDAFLAANLAAQLLQGADMPPARAQQPVDMTVRILESGRSLTRDALAGVIFVPFIFVFVLYFAAQTTSSFVMGGVVSEKSNRVMEILITSATPMQILSGKIIGLGALGMTQMVVWVAAGWLATTFGQGIDFLRGVSVPADLVVMGLVYFLLQYLVLSALMGALGALVGSEEESRQYAGWLSLVLVIPFFFVTQFLQDSAGALPVFLSLFPLTAGASMILRIGIGAVPVWQLAASLGILAVTSVVFMWAAAKIFRWGMLLYGKKFNLRDIGDALRGSAPAVTAAKGEGATS